VAGLDLIGDIRVGTELTMIPAMRFRSNWRASADGCRRRADTHAVVCHGTRHR